MLECFVLTLFKLILNIAKKLCFISWLTRRLEESQYALEINFRENEEAINIGQSRDTRNIGYNRHGTNKY